MDARLRLLLVAALGAPGFAGAAPPCDGWVSGPATLERHGPAGHFVLRAAPADLEADRRTLLAHCQVPAAVRPPLDIGPVDIDAQLAPPTAEKSGGVVELKLRLRAERLQLRVE